MVGNVQDGEFCSTNGQINAEQFEKAMRKQLRQYASRRLCDFLAHCCHEEADRAQVSALSLLPVHFWHGMNPSDLSCLAPIVGTCL